MLILPAVAAGALPVGDSNVWISVGNRRREFRVHVPSDEARRNPSGLIVAIHGWRNSKEWACDTIGRSSAQRHGFVVACPQGREQWFQSGWNSNIKARPVTRPRPRPCQYDPRFFLCFVLHEPCLPRPAACPPFDHLCRASRSSGPKTTSASSARSLGTCSAICPSQTAARSPSASASAVR